MKNTLSKIKTILEIAKKEVVKVDSLEKLENLRAS